MAHPDPAQLRNVAVLGHRGSGKTSLVEAMLFAAGSTTRLGRVADGTTVCDFDEDEQRRGMSISAALCHLDWGGVKVNLLDTPGEPSFQGDTLAAMRAVDAALMVVNATAGVEVQTERYWNRADELGLPRAVVINMLDRERADFDAAVAAVVELAPGAVPIQIPIGSEAGFRGVVNLVSMTATTYAGAPATATTGPIPDELADAAQAAREHLIDMVAESDDALIEKYLEGEEITTDELIAAILVGVAEGRIFPIVCAAGDSGIGVDRDARPHHRGAALARAGRRGARRTGRRSRCASRRSPTSSAAASACCGCSPGCSPSDSHATCAARRRQGARGPAVHAAGQGARAAHRDRPRRHRRRREAQGGRDRRRADHRADRVAFDPITFPPALMSFAVTARDAADEDRLHTALRRMRDEDPTLDVHHDEQTGDLIVGGLSQMHVEVLAGAHRAALRRRAWTWPRRTCPTARPSPARPRPRASTRSRAAGAGSTPTAGSASSRSRAAAGFEFVDKVVGGAIPRAFIPAVEKGVVEAHARRRAGRRPDRRPARDPLRRQAPPGGLVGDGVQDRGRRWPCGRPSRRRGRCCWSRSCWSRSRCPPTTWAT